MRMFFLALLFGAFFLPAHTIAQEDGASFEEVFLTHFPKDSFLDLIFDEFPEEEKIYREYLAEIYETETEEFFLEKIKWLQDKLDAWYFKHFLQYSSKDAIYEYLAAKRDMLVFLRENHPSSCFGWMRDRVDPTKFKGSLQELEEGYRKGVAQVFFSALRNWGEKYKTISRAKAYQKIIEMMVKKSAKSGEIHGNIHFVNGPSSKIYSPEEERTICVDTSKFYEFLVEKSKKDAVFIFRSFIGEELLDQRDGRIVKTIK